MRRCWGKYAGKSAFVLISLAGCLSSSVRAAELWTAPVTVSTDLNSDAGRPRIATDRNNHWATVWERTANSASAYSRSTNDAISWGATTDLPLPSGAVYLGSPDVAAEITSGTLLAAYSVDSNSDNKAETAFAISSPGQTTHTLLDAQLSFSSGDGYVGLAGPRIASGGNRVWVTAGTAASSSDEELALYRSIDDGANWSSPVVVNQTTASLGLDRNIALASDRANNWVAIWERRLASNPANIDIFFTRSADNGVNWSPAANFNLSSTAGAQPTVAGDSSGAFVAMYVQGTGASSLKAYRTTDGGATWSGPVAVNVSGPTITDTPAVPAVACDGQGSCVAVWSATPTGATRKRLFYATSANRGQTWSVPDVLTTPTAGLDAGDDLPRIEYDGLGRWVAVWQRTTFSPSAGVAILSSRLVFPVRADLSITQQDSPDPAVVNGDVTYALTVKNDGPSSATNVVVKDTLPTTGSVSVTQSQGTHTETSGVVTLNLGGIASGASANASIVVRLGGTGAYTNVASLTSTEPDIDTADRISTETTRVLVEGVDLQGKWESFIYKVPHRPDKGKLHVKARLSVSNFGTRPAGQTVVLLVLSDDEVLSDDDAFVDVIRVDMLGSAKTRNFKWEKNIHRHTPWQGRYLLAILDSEKRIVEADETNNTVQSDQLTIP